MNAELEALVLALDAVIEARAGDQAERLENLFQSRINDVLSRYPGVSRERLMLAVDFAHRRWIRAQQNPSSLPPKA